jgi:uncharacterized protein YgbK (DUF1537 family)
MQAVVVDAETDADLNVIALASLTLSPPFFLVGSAGLAEHVPAAARLAGTPACRPDVVTSGAILTVVGSVSAISRQQADVLTQLRALARIDVPPALLDDEPSAADWAQCQSRLGQAIADGSDVLLVIEDRDTADLRRGRTVCRALAQLVAPHTNSIGGLISTGGETTRAILLAMGIDAMRVVGQVEAGIPLSLAAGQRAIPIISKAGGFGTADTLVHCYDTLARARSAAIHEESIPATAPGHYNYPQ